MLQWIINNLLTESQLDVIPPGEDRALRFHGNPSLMDRTKIIADAIEAMEEQAEEEFLERVRLFSKKFPNRIVTVVGGMGSLNVYLGRKVNAHAAIIARPWRWQWSGETQFSLNHGGDFDAPEFMAKYRDELFLPMEQAEDECDNIYQYRPMVACGTVRFQNGERL